MDGVAGLAGLGLDTPHSLLLDMTGRVVGINSQWWEATTELPLGIRCSLGLDYLTMCESATGEGARDLRRLARELRSVLSGRCHSVAVACPDYARETGTEWRAHVTRIETVGRSWAMLTWVDTTGCDARSTAPDDHVAVSSSGVAHDVNNVLTAILANAELALRGLPKNDNNAARAHLEEIRTSVTYAAELVGRLLSGARARRHSNVLVRLGSVARDAFEIVRPRVRDDVRVTIHAQDDMATAEGDVTQLRQVAVNLISNAVDAIGDGPGTISITAGHAANGYVHLTVADSGCGMDTGARERVFEPFYTTKPNGHGLGLALVREIVEHCGGVITVDSTPGTGATFRVLLPSQSHS